MTEAEMYGLYQEREKVFWSQYMGMRWSEPEPRRMFTFHERPKMRDVISPSMDDAKLTPEDTKELDDFLNSFASVSASDKM